jgi:hypothetical protein
MRIFFAIYAVAVIGLSYLQLVDSLLGRLALWGYMALWAAALIMVTMRTRWWPWVGLAAIVPLVGMLLVNSILRVAFILEHRGMDCATCNGSPAAFVLLWAHELVFLLPGIVLCLWLVRTLRRTWRK